MVFLIWLMLFLAAVSFLLVLGASWRHSISERYSGGRPVTCPGNRQPAVVNIDVRHAVATVMDGRSCLRLSECSRWPEHSACDQKCLSQAIQAEPYNAGEVKAGRKQIYHLPVLLAAFVAWYLGAIWHSHWMFRERWMQSTGLTTAQVKQIVWWLSPQLLTVTVCLLFAYGVAALLAISHRKGILQGVLMAALLCGAVIAMSWYGIANLPHELVMVEAGYTVLATLTIGAIVGGLYDKVVLQA